MIGHSITIARSTDVFFGQDRGYPDTPLPTVSDGWGGIDNAMVKVYGQVPEYQGVERPPTRKRRLAPFRLPKSPSESPSPFGHTHSVNPHNLAPPVPRRRSAPNPHHRPSHTPPLTTAQPSAVCSTAARPPPPLTPRQHTPPHHPTIKKKEATNRSPLPSPFDQSLKQITFPTLNSASKQLDARETHSRASVPHDDIDQKLPGSEDESDSRTAGRWGWGFPLSRSPVSAVSVGWARE